MGGMAFGSQNSSGKCPFPLTNHIPCWRSSQWGQAWQQPPQSTCATIQLGVTFPRERMPWCEDEEKLKTGEQMKASWLLNEKKRRKWEKGRTFGDF